jgi:hypothetical protein
VCAESIGKTVSLGVAWPWVAKPIPPGTAGNTVGQSRAKALSRKAVRCNGELESESQTEIPAYIMRRKQ